MSAKVLGLLTLLAAVSVESFAQLGLKIGAAGGPRALAQPYRKLAESRRLTSSPSFWTAAGVAAYALEIFLYTLVLRWLDVSAAFPMSSLCFVCVALLSRRFLGETVDRSRWLGVLCILAGTALMTL